MSLRNLYLDLSLRNMPRLLGMVDRNKYSPTYGCFDRNYWHYKTSDFPSGMYQVGTLALTLAYLNKIPDNNFYNKKRIKEIILAGINFMIKSSHRDGSCDEFYPNEKALGATSISLYAATESYLLLKEKNKNFEKFFKKRADWLLKQEEPGKIANHQASSALALYNVYLITNNQKYLEGAQNRIKKTLQWQSDEGWFLEYTGCDPGYQTVTIDYLAKYYKKSKDESLLKPLEKAVEFASYFMHPDGSYGGEYGSRSTYHFLPHGFELLSEMPLAKYIVNKWLEGVKNKKNESIEDDRYFIFDSFNNLQAYLDFTDKQTSAAKSFKKYFKEAGFFIFNDNKYYGVISLNKNGICKIFKEGKLVYNDAGFIGKLNSKTVTSQNRSTHEVNENKIKTIGFFSYSEQQNMTVFKNIVFRTILLLLGSFSTKFIKKTLTKKLITGKKDAPVRLIRSFEIGNQIKINDEIIFSGSMESLSRGCGFSTIYVPGSRYYQDSVLDPWKDIDIKSNKIVLETVL